MPEANQNQSQNLINPVMVKLPSSSEGRPAGFYKTIILDILGIFSAFSIGYSYREFLANGLSPLFLIGAVLVFGVISAMQAFLCKNAWRRAIIIFCEVAMLSSFFYILDWRFLCAAAVCAFLFLFWGYSGSRSEIDYGMEVRPFRASKSVIANVTTGILLFAIVVYIPLWNQNSIFIPQESFNTIFDWGAKTIESFYPNIMLSGSLGSFANNFVQHQLESNASFQNINSQAQQSLITQNANGVISDLSKNIGIKIQPSDSVSVVMYQFITKTLADWKDSLHGTFFIGWSVVVFFMARSVGIIFVWINQFLFFIFYEIFLAFRFMHIKEEMWTRELIEY